MRSTLQALRPGCMAHSAGSTGLPASSRRACAPRQRAGWQTVLGASSSGLGLQQALDPAGKAACVRRRSLAVQQQAHLHAGRDSRPVWWGVRMLSTSNILPPHVHVGSGPAICSQYMPLHPHRYKRLWRHRLAGEAAAPAQLATVHVAQHASRMSCTFTFRRVKLHVFALVRRCS